MRSYVLILTQIRQYASPHLRYYVATHMREHVNTFSLKKPSCRLSRARGIKNSDISKEAYEHSCNRDSKPEGWCGKDHEYHSHRTSLSGAWQEVPHYRPRLIGWCNDDARCSNNGMANNF